MLRAICAAGLAFGVEGAEFQAREHALEEVWEKELEAPAAKKATNPVKRVVNLLQKMRSELEEEAAKESEMYDKMVCWCETSEKEKTQAVQDAEARDVQLGSEIEERAAKFGALSANIEQTKKEIAANSESLEQATQLREKEASEFRGEEKDSVQAVTNLRNAVAVLSKHQSTQAMLQLSEGLVAPMQVLLRDCALKYELAVAGRAERRGARALVLLALGSQAAGGGASAEVGALLMRALDVHTKFPELLPLDFAERAVARAANPAAESRTFLQMSNRQPVYESRSAGRSAGIYGVLQQMLEEFEAELTTSQKDELKAQDDFKALAATKTEEIETGTRKLDAMQAEDAGNSKALSDAKEDLDNTRKQRSEDVKFLQNLKLTCNDLDAQMEKRSKTRSAETMAVSEAISVLTEDDNREMLAKSVSFLQVHSASAAETAARRTGAAAALRSAAGSPAFEADDLLSAWHGRGHSMALGAGGPRGRLSTLAVAVQLDSFTKVKEMMDTMVAELKKQQTEEVAFKGYCGKELDETEKTSFDKNEHKKDLEAELGRLEALTTQLAEEIAAAKDEIAKTEVDIKQASQSREEENAEFQRVVADQRATQEILNKALMKLKDFYEKGIGKAVLAQKSVQTPPVQFNDFKTNAGASPVIGLIEQIIEDSKALEAECTAGETKAQADYQALVTDGNLAIKELQGAVTDKSKASAAAAEDRAQASADLTNTVGELESLAQYDADLHAECDFTLKNFDIRQAARLQEIEAIQQAKGILSGAGGQ